MSALREAGTLLAALGLLGVGPCGPLPGGRLDGPVLRDVVEDWSFVEDYERCQLELRPPDPHSISVNCYSHDGLLHVGSLQSPRKRWPALVAQDSRVRIRIAGRVYERVAEPVADAETLNRVFRARARKYQSEEPSADLRAPDGYRAWRLDPRP